MAPPFTKIKAARAVRAGRFLTHISDVEGFVVSVPLVVKGQSVCFPKPVQQ